jgi:hypothetical protein
MGIKIKAGTSFVLPVTIEDNGFNSISAIEFLFKQNKNGATIKTAYWSANGESRDAVKQAGENTILISFSREDTYLFRQEAQFYMDTRIHYDGSDNNPFTKIVTLTMRETLFSEGEEVGP